MNAKELWYLHDSITTLQNVIDIWTGEFLLSARALSLGSESEPLPFLDTLSRRAKKYNRVKILVKMLRLFEDRNAPWSIENLTMLQDVQCALLEMGALMKEMSKELEKHERPRK